MDESQLRRRLDTLRSKHGACEIELEILRSSPSVADEKITEVKIRKLWIKDQIAGIERLLASNKEASMNKLAAEVGACNQTVRATITN